MRASSPWRINTLREASGSRNVGQIADRRRGKSRGRAGEFPLLTGSGGEPGAIQPVFWHRCQGPDLAPGLQYAKQVPIASRSPQLGFTSDLLLRFRAAEAAVVRDARRQRALWQYRLTRGKVQFDLDVRRAHRRLKQGLVSFLRESSVPNALTAPLVYSLVVPLALADLWITLYQWLCFPIYGISRVRRRDYFVLDRHRLGYLNAIEKINCTFCSYANGLIAYIREIAARTEQYWCPIKHGRRVRAPHAAYPLFADYGDAAGYRERGPALRLTLDTSYRGRRQISGARKGQR